MKKLSFLLLLISALAFSCKWPTKPKSEKTHLTPCIVDKVVMFGIGEKHTLQLDPEWKAYTGCGEFTMRREVKVGDTIWVETRYSEK